MVRKYMSTLDILYILKLSEAVVLRYNQNGCKLDIEDKTIILEHLLSFLKSRIDLIQRRHKEVLEMSQKMSEIPHILRNGR